MSRFLLVATLVVASLGLARHCIAEPIYYEAFLDGPSEAPPNASPGFGYSLLTFDLAANIMRVQASFQDLVAPTTVAHIHGPTDSPFSGTAGVMTQVPTFGGFPAGVTSGSYDMTFDLSLASTYNPAFLNGLGGGTPEGAALMLASALAEGKAYLNIHSSVFPAGEIRGFYTVVPEPSSLALAVLGGSVLSIGLARVRRGAVRSMAD